uniref:D-glutamate cyclase n=1 Tax=Neogobius melanostomus TaxID=47308 RepID=A0A8C6US25_9GOBI
MCIYSTGFQQANVLLLPSALAKDFEAFCRNNTAPLPLLYVSKTGEASTVFVADLSVLFASGNLSLPPGGHMRPVPTEMLDTAVEVTHLNPLAHGAPVHIGDPALLGIQDLSRPEYGDAVDPQPGDVPVFWACGVTSMEAVLSTSKSGPGPPPDPLSFRLSQHPLLYSLASKRAVHKIRELEKIVAEDPGNRGISAIVLQDELLLSCLALSHASSVAITTGFPTHYMHNPPDETDGPPGAVAMANMLLSLGKQVTMVSDRRGLQLNQDLIDEAVTSGVLSAPVPLVTFEDNGPDSAVRFLCHDGDISKPRYDHLVAIERSGRAADGNYYNMRGINIKHLVDPIDDLFVAAKEIPGISTTGIGDGGNELGMGKMKERVKSLMPKGDLIACDVPADYAITCGVSNWGGYAVACGLFLLQNCPSHQRYLKKGLGLNGTAPPEESQRWTSGLPSVDKEESFLSTLVRFGVRSGKTGNLAMEVDGLTFHPTHSELIARLLKVTHST